uniref:Succinate dehydrogenase subunit 4 n=1 Tax=Corchorus olitorius TaxID=93759 RepID=A0A1C9I9T9_9ROSI|nr:succinate dehydrogenase subunit 4 [Corchorus olitorius]AOO95968.1 succinate dehydrogenase subunit 4 [Corchorus olitorius]
MVLAFCRRGSVIPICLYLLVGRYMKERKSVLKNESSKKKRIELLQRITAAFTIPLIIISKKVSFTFFLTNLLLFQTNLFLLWHINAEIEEILEDHVHHPLTRNVILVQLNLVFIIISKDFFLSFVSFKN